MVPRKLPSELEEEILVRVPPPSVSRFRTVCKEWNALFSDKRFVNKNFAFARPEFVLHTGSNRTYSIRVNLNDDDPTIKVHDFTIDIPCLDLVNCDGYFFLFDEIHDFSMVWNPWLRHSRWIQAKTLTLCGMGYVSCKLEKSYKIVGFTYCDSHVRFAVFEFETNAWKFIDHAHYDEKIYKFQSLRYNNLSLNGNLYWTACNNKTGQYCIRILDLSKEIVKPFCILPCKKEVLSSYNTLVLVVYKGDRFSLLEQCMRTMNIEIWVTKKKISNGDDGDIVLWVKFMIVSKPNFPRFDHWTSSYLVDFNIYGKSFVMCCREEKTKKACVYIVREDLCKNIKIDYVFGTIRCSVYVPSLIPIS